MADIEIGKTISNTVSNALLKYFPSKRKQAEFFRLANDAFDIMNSRTKDNPNPLKCSFGLHLAEQEHFL
jgi:hypothetical protein